jgi:Na+-driven multidrug efflux pump
MKPAWKTIRRILRVGLPSGAEGLIFWGANFVVLYFVNTLGTQTAAAHNVVIRVEALSYMTGFAISIAAATMVGQSLGMKDPIRARRSGTVAYAVGGGVMTSVGIAFLIFAEPMCRLMTDSPAVVAEATPALRIAGLSQVAFAAMMIYGGALRGAGDTTAVMTRNLSSALVIRALGAAVLVKGFGLGFLAVWWLLVIDLVVRGGLLAARFYRGSWVDKEV